MGCLPAAPAPGRAPGDSLCRALSLSKGSSKPRGYVPSPYLPQDLPGRHVPASLQYPCYCGPNPSSRSFHSIPLKALGKWGLQLPLLSTLPPLNPHPRHTPSRVSFLVYLFIKNHSWEMISSPFRPPKRLPEVAAAVSALSWVAAHPSGSQDPR